MLVGRSVPVIVKVPVAELNEEPVISLKVSIYVTSHVKLWQTAGDPSTVTIN